VGGEERGHVGGEVAQRAGGHARILGADDAVDEADRERQPAGVREHLAETLGGGVGRHLRRLVEPAAHGRDDLVGQRQQIVDPVGSRVGLVPGQSHVHSLVT
jgi:hypothetical protein